MKAIEILLAWLNTGDDVCPGEGAGCKTDGDGITAELSGITGDAGTAGTPGRFPTNSASATK